MGEELDGVGGSLGLGVGHIHGIIAVVLQGGSNVETVCSMIAPGRPFIGALVDDRFASCWG